MTASPLDSPATSTNHTYASMPIVTPGSAAAFYRNASIPAESGPLDYPCLVYPPAKPLSPKLSAPKLILYFRLRR